MRNITISICGVTGLTFCSRPTQNSHVPIIDYSGIGAQISLDNPIGTSNEFTFTIPRWGNNQDLFQIFGKVTERSLTTSQYAMLRDTVHLSDQRFILTSALNTGSTYPVVHIQTEAIQVQTTSTTLNANTIYTITRGWDGTRPLPFFVANSVLEQCAVTTVPCYWKGRAFTISLENTSGGFDVWYRGVLTSNPVLQGKNIVFSGCFIENIVSGDAFNTLSARSTTLAPYADVTGKNICYMAARDYMTLGSMTLTSGSIVGSNYWSGISSLVADGWPQNADREYCRNVANAVSGVTGHGTTWGLPCNINTDGGNFSGTIQYSSYLTSSHVFRLFIDVPTQTGTINPGALVSITADGVCGGFTYPLTSAIAPDTLTYPYSSGWLTNKGQVKYSFPIVNLEADFAPVTPTTLRSCYAVTPYTWKNIKYIIFPARYHTKEIPESTDAKSFGHYVKQRGWTWNSDDWITDLVGNKVTSPSSILLYPFNMKTALAENHALLKDEIVQVSDLVNNVTERFTIYSLRVDREDLANHTQRRQIQYEVAKTFWEVGMDIIYLMDDFVTTPGGSYFQVKWQERDGSELEGSIRLRRYPAKDYSSTYYAYIVAEANYENGPLLGFGTWAGWKTCELHPCANVFAESTQFIVDLLCSCEGNLSNVYDVFPFGYNLFNYVDQASILSISFPFDNISYVEPTSGKEEDVSEAMKQFFLVAGKGLIGKHVLVNGSWNYLVSAIDLNPVQGLNGVKYTFSDDNLLVLPTLVASDTVYTRYHLQMDENTSYTYIDRTAESNFASGQALDFDLKRYIKNIEDENLLIGIGKDLACQLHTLFGYPQKLVSFTVPFESVSHINLGDGVSITSKYMDGQINSDKTYTGRVINYSHDPKQGVSQLQISVTETFYAGYDISFVVDFSPTYVLQIEEGPSGGLKTWASRLTNGSSWDITIGNTGIYNGPSGEYYNTNYLGNLAAIKTLNELGSYSGNSIASVWLENYGIWGVHNINSITITENYIRFTLTYYTGSNGESWSSFPDIIDTTKSYRLHINLTQGSQLFQLGSSEIGL